MIIIYDHHEDCQERGEKAYTHTERYARELMQRERERTTKSKLRSSCEMICYAVCWRKREKSDSRSSFSELFYYPPVSPSFLMMISFIFLFQQEWRETDAKHKKRWERMQKNKHQKMIEGKAMLYLHTSYERVNWNTENFHSPALSWYLCECVSILFPAPEGQMRIAESEWMLQIAKWSSLEWG